MAERVTVIVIGYGQRGQAYVKFCRAYPYKIQVVAVAEPSKYKQTKFEEFSPLATTIVSDWRDIIEFGKIADAVLICTQDQTHSEIAIAFARLGYHILCEKPLATQYADCRAICDAVKASDVLLGIGHVLRYSPHNQAIFKIIRSGVLGTLISINHTEPIGYSHFAHSYVRGNWRNTKEATFSLLAYSCLDLDMINRYFTLSDPTIRWTRVTSFGSLSYFGRWSKPRSAGNATKCLECPILESCPYSAKKAYLDPFVDSNIREWPINVITDELSEKGIIAALGHTRYGTCVYELDNDVCDHQVVNLEYCSLGTGKKASAVFQMIAFSEAQCSRKTSIYGSLGELTSDSIGPIVVFEFGTKHKSIIDVAVREEEKGGHGGGDFGLMQAFSDAVYDVVHKRKNVPEAQMHHLGISVDQILESHHLVFQAESARLAGRIVANDFVPSEFAMM